MTNNNDDGSLEIPWNISDATYNKLKWCVMVLLPAISTLYFTLSDVLDLPATTQVIGSIAALCTFLGIFLKRSTAKFEANQTFENHIVVTENPNGAMNFSLELGTLPEDLATKDTVLFKVVRPPVE